MLANEALAKAAPPACGVNVMVNVALCPAAIVSGNETPLITNSVVLDDSDVTVTLAPEAARVPVRLLLEPTFTLPKLRVVGETANCPAAVPVPERLIASVGFEAFDTTEMFPVAEPAVCGAKIALNVKLCPAERVNGKSRPGALNPVPLTLTWLMTTLDPPELVTVSDKAAL